MASSLCHEQSTTSNIHWLHSSLLVCRYLGHSPDVGIRDRFILFDVQPLSDWEVFRAGLRLFL